MESLNPCAANSGKKLFTVTAWNGGWMNHSSYVWADTENAALNVAKSHPYFGVPASIREELDPKTVLAALRYAEALCAHREKREKKSERDFFFSKSTLPKPRKGGGGFLGIGCSKNPFRR